MARSPTSRPFSRPSTAKSGNRWCARRTARSGSRKALLALQLGPGIELPAPVGADALAGLATLKFAAGLHPVTKQHRPALLAVHVDGGSRALPARPDEASPLSGEGAAKCPGLPPRGAAKQPPRGEVLDGEQLRVRGPREFLPVVAAVLIQRSIRVQRDDGDRRNSNARPVENAEQRTTFATDGQRQRRQCEPTQGVHPEYAS